MEVGSAMLRPSGGLATLKELECLANICDIEERWSGIDYGRVVIRQRDRLLFGE